MPSSIADFEKINIAVVIPCYRVEREIGAVLAAVPGYVRHILVIDDASPDRTSEIVAGTAQSDSRIELIRHAKNLGVGGAMKTGFARALALGAQIVVKVDGDGQMDTAYLPDLLMPLVKGQADYTKGNRFRDFQALQKMPLVRRIGNMGLGFLSKAATGYWNLFDPTNGYVAIHADVLAQVPLAGIDNTYFFETSMLANLYLLGALVKDVPMPARYQGENSNLSVRRTLLEFPLKLLQTLLRRILLKNLIYDFSMASIYLFSGIPLLLFGLIFGSIKWVSYARQAIPAPTGTVMLPTLSVLLGIQFLIAAIEIDIRSSPKEPLSKALLD
jgi:glycosyltransferase involved in cell wall biosynthesis